ncbi:hypothetical protein ACJX0J_035558, partial [Zea mays]
MCIHRSFFNHSFMSIIIYIIKVNGTRIIVGIKMGVGVGYKERKKIVLSGFMKKMMIGKMSIDGGVVLEIVRGAKSISYPARVLVVSSTIYYQQPIEVYYLCSSSIEDIYAPSLCFEGEGEGGGVKNCCLGDRFLTLVQ